MPVQTYKPKCPYCGWIRAIELNVEGDTVEVVKGIVEDIQAFVDQFKNRRETGQWIDMPPCPNCKRVHQYNPDTGEARR